MGSFLQRLTFSAEGTAHAILAANEKTAQHGLTLTQEEALTLAEVYRDALADNHLVEFGAGGVLKIQEAFASSDFADRSNYAEIVNAMTETFYYIKGEVRNEIRDDTVIAAMLDLFDNHCMGSLELFISRETEILIRYLKEGRQSLIPDAEDNYNEEPEYSWQAERDDDTAWDKEQPQEAEEDDA